MVVLNMYGEIPKTYISHKLNLYVSNLPNSGFNTWRDSLADDLLLTVHADQLYREHLGANLPSGIVELYKKVFPNHPVPDSFGRDQCIELARQMICIDQDYSYDDMPLGGWDTNCFDGRLCEEDYAEKINDLIAFLSTGQNRTYSIPSPMPQWTYSSNYDWIPHYRIFWGGDPAEDYIASLKEWGKLFDAFLQKRNDYLLFDYLVNSIHKDNECNECHYIKAYSLCQLFLENEHEYELDTKLIPFIDIDGSEGIKKEYATLLRQLRNKIAHGDFLGFENKAEEFAKKYMDGRYEFDYSEYSRKNWVLLHICCTIDDIVRNLILTLLFDREKLEQIKKH